MRAGPGPSTNSTFSTALDKARMKFPDELTEVTLTPDRPYLFSTYLCSSFDI